MQARHKKALALGTLVSLVLAGVLLWTASPEMSYYDTISKVDVTEGNPRGTGGTPPTELIRVGGTVKPGSLHPLTASSPAALVLTDGAKDLAVELRAELPTMLREGQEAVAEGRLVKGVLQATRVFPRFDDPLKKAN